MNATNRETIQMTPVTNLEMLREEELQGAVGVYQRAFADPPYGEAFTDEEAEAALQYVLDKGGDLMFGKADNEVVALAGGYMKPDGVYYIEELAVTPSKQGQGMGRQALKALMVEAANQYLEAFEIRTTILNEKAIQLYCSEGFQSEGVTEIVAQTRQDGAIGLDERVYLSKSSKETDMEKPRKLKRTAIAYPSGNTTAVVFDQLLDVGREELNSFVMAAWKDKEGDRPEVEQCCFVTTPCDRRAMARVEMFGGEFCGNATRSVIRLLTEGKDYEGLIEVSGVDRPLSFGVSDEIVSLEMPLPEDGKQAERFEEGTLVQLDGISQLVVTDAVKQLDQTPREMLLGLLEQNKYELAGQPAVGVTYYDEASKNATFCVWVREVNTIFDETACGSGTCAIGVALALNEKQDQKLEVIQPSGESIVTEAIFDSALGRVNTSTIAGKVAVLYDGELG